jgi:uncharacterized membrane protein
VSKKWIGIAALIFIMTIGIVACASTPSVITLSASEAARARSVADNRERIALQARVENARHMREIAALQDQANQLELQAEQLRFDVKKAHGVSLDSPYTLDELGGRLIREGPEVGKGPVQ